MGLVIAIYTKEAFKEYVMPAINNADHSIMLNKNYFNLRNDVRLDFEVINDSWKIKINRKYRIYLDKREIQENTVLSSSQILRILTYDKKQIILMVRMSEEIFGAYKKYDIQRMGRITIGEGENNIIRYDYQRLISKEHAEIIRKGRNYVISCKGQNGLYVNSKYITSTESLRFGDYINI